MTNRDILLEHEKKMNTWASILLWSCVIIGYTISIIISYMELIPRTPAELLYAMSIGVFICAAASVFSFVSVLKRLAKYALVIGSALFIFTAEIYVAFAFPFFVLWLVPISIACLYFQPRLASVAAAFTVIFFIIQLIIFKHPYTVFIRDTSLITFLGSFSLVSAIMVAFTVQAKKMLFNVIQREEEQARLLTDMNTIVATSANISNHVSITGKELLDAVNTGENSVQVIAATSEELSATVEEISANLSEINGSSSTVARTAGGGGQAIEEINRQMEIIRNLVQKLASMIAGLNNSSQKIGEVTQVISGIADQTNLLALNAAIEAARAGEHGRGFAVVSNEVRVLAENSGKAAGEVSALIKQIQSETKEVVVAMEEGISAVDSCSQITRETGENIKEIVKLIQEVAGRITQIAMAIKEIEGTGQQVASSSEEQLSFMQKIAKEARNLTEMSEDLNRNLKKFAVS